MSCSELLALFSGCSEGCRQAGLLVFIPPVAEVSHNPGFMGTFHVCLSFGWFAVFLHSPAAQAWSLAVAGSPSDLVALGHRPCPISWLVPLKLDAPQPSPGSPAVQTAIFRVAPGVVCLRPRAGRTQVRLSMALPGWRQEL